MNKLVYQFINIFPNNKYMTIPNIRYGPNGKYASLFFRPLIIKNEKITAAKKKPKNKAINASHCPIINPINADNLISPNPNVSFLYSLDVIILSKYIPLAVNKAK